MSEYCFNPYFHGVVAAINKSATNSDSITGFQSLFSWSGRCNNGEEHLFVYVVSGFNPYFHGVVAAMEIVMTKRL